MEYDTVLVRYGEIGVKSSSVRRRMEERLRRNAESLVAGAGVEEATACVVAEASLDEITEVTAELARDEYDGTHPFTSVGIEREAGAVGVVTGEAVGQKSSQTARNLRATDAACSLPVHRPLLTFDKPEAVEEATVEVFDGA